MSYLRSTHPERYQAKMEMVDTISLEGIFSLQYTCNNHIEEINQVYSQYGRNCGDLPSSNDRQGRNHKAEKHRPRICSPDTWLE